MDGTVQDSTEHIELLRRFAHANALEYIDILIANVFAALSRTQNASTTC